MAEQWVKISTDTLIDVKMVPMSDHGWRAFYECVLWAKTTGDEDGNTVHINQMAFTRQIPAETLKEYLHESIEREILEDNGDGTYFVVNYEKRQKRMSNAERQRRYRQRKKVTERIDEGLPPFEPEEIVQAGGSTKGASEYTTFQMHDIHQQIEDLYVKVTGQIMIPPNQYDVVFQNMDAILAHYDNDVNRAVTSGKLVFQKWCNTRSKTTGKTYSKTNAEGWTGRWLEEIAPDVDKSVAVVIPRPSSMCQTALNLYKKVDQSGRPDDIKIYRDHILSCNFCSGAVNANDVKNKLLQLTKGMKA